MQMPHAEWREFAYVVIEDPMCRVAVVQALLVAGWRVEQRATAFHLIEDLCDLIIEGGERAGPGLLVLDARARGCSGISIAHGLRALGVEVRIILIADHEEVSDDPLIAICGRDRA